MKIENSTMNLICKPFAVLILLAFFNIGKAQNSQFKPRLFNALDNVLPCKISQLEKNFLSGIGKNIELSLGKNLIFKGYVTSSIQRYHNLKSVIIKLSDFNGAILSISRRVNNDHTITYVGRIINEKYADGYELKTDITGNYFLEKIKIEDLMQDHE